MGKLIARALIAVMCLSANFSAMAQDKLTNVSFGSVGGATDAGIYLADELGLFRKEGITLDIRRITSGPQLTAAIATNQLDVAGIAVGPGLFAAVDQDIRMVVVGDKNSTNGRFSAAALTVRKELLKPTTRETILGLKGKTLAVSAKASGGYMLAAKLLEKYGLSTRDVRLVEMPLNNMPAAAASGSVDAMSTIEPFITQMERSGAAAVASDYTEVAPPDGYTSVVLVYSEGFAKKREIARRFMKAYVQGVRIYNDAIVKGKDADKVLQILSQRSGLPVEVLKQMRPAGLDPNQIKNVASLKAFQEFFVKEGLLRQPIDVEKLYDGSFADAAVRELGKY